MDKQTRQACLWEAPRNYQQRTLKTAYKKESQRKETSEEVPAEEAENQQT